jgi:RNA polymerase sigma-70 factor, ECF subfamily
VSSWAPIRGLLSNILAVDKVADTRAIEQVTASDKVSDESVMERVQQGDTQAMGLLYDRYARLVLSIGLRILKDASEAQELLQDVFLYAFQKCHDFDASKGSLRSWLVQIAYSRAFNKREYLALRRFYDYCYIDEVLDLVPADCSAERLGLANELRGLLTNAFLSLSPQQKTTLEMFFWEGYSLREISVRLNETLGNTRNHYYRGLEKLKEILKVALAPSPGKTE